MKLKTTLLPIVIFSLFSGLALSQERDTDSSVNDARLEGQMWASYALNQHLNPFSLDMEVVSGKATLIGQVEEWAQKDLAEQIAMGIDGIDEVDNQITVVADPKVVQTERSERSERSFGDRVGDATTTTTVKSKLLWNRNTEGLAIDVSTRDGVVMLQGETDSDASRQLAERLAINTDGVRSVNNQLTVNADYERPESDRDMGDSISDSWITTKVKSTLLFSSNVSGTDISVTTVDGVVTLEGHVDNGAQKALANELTKDIRGVMQVNDAAVSVAAR